MARLVPRRLKTRAIVSVNRGELLRGLSGKADLIVANIVAEALVEMAPMLPDCLKQEGVFIGSGLTEARAPWVEDALERAGVRPFRRLLREDWVAVLARREGRA